LLQPQGPGVGAVGEGGLAQEYSGATPAPPVVPLLFYQKPSLAHIGLRRGSSRVDGCRSTGGEGEDREGASLPVQVVGLDGQAGAVGLPQGQESSSEETRRQQLLLSRQAEYTVVSWATEHALDAMEIRRLQVMFVVLMLFNVTLSALLFTTNADGYLLGVERSPDLSLSPPNPLPQAFDRWGASGSGADGDALWQQRTKELESLAGTQLAIVILLAGLGLHGVLRKNVLVIRCYMVGVGVAFLVGCVRMPSPTMAIRPLMDGILALIARSLTCHMSISYVNASLLR